MLRGYCGALRLRFSWNCIRQRFGAASFRDPGGSLPVWTFCSSSKSLHGSPRRFALTTCWVLPCGDPATQEHGRSRYDTSTEVQACTHLLGSRDWTLAVVRTSCRNLEWWRGNWGQGISRNRLWIMAIKIDNKISIHDSSFPIDIIYKPRGVGQLKYQGRPVHFWVRQKKCIWQIPVVKSLIVMWAFLQENAIKMSDARGVHGHPGRPLSNAPVYSIHPCS